MFNNEFEILFHSNLLYQAYPESPDVRALVEKASNTFVRSAWQWTNSFYLRRRPEVSSSFDRTRDHALANG